MGWRADTLWVTDFAQSRINLFSREGEVLEVVTPTGPVLPGISTRPTPPWALMADGSIVGVPLTSGAVTDALFIRMNRTGQLIEQFGRFSRDAGTMVSRGSGAQRFAVVTPGGSAEGSNSALTDVLPERSAVVSVHRPLPTGPERSYFQVDVVRSATDTVFSRRYSYVPEAITDEVEEAYIADQIEAEQATLAEAGIDIPVPPAVFEEMMREFHALPNFQEPVTQVIAGRDGTIWLRLEEIGFEQVEWVVLDPTGDTIGVLQTSPDLRILEAQRDLVWATVEDDLGVKYLIRYRVQE
jgi:hypothetical protein